MVVPGGGEEAVAGDATRDDLHRAAYEAMFDPHVLLGAVRDTTGRIVDFEFLDANRAACAFSHVEPDGLTGARWLTLLGEARPDGLFEACVETVEAGGTWAADDFVYISPNGRGDGQRYDIRAVTVGDVLSFSWRNVTARFQRERELARSELQFRLLAENATDVVMQMDALGDFIWVSPSMERVIGWRPVELIGASRLELIHPDDLPIVAQARDATMHGHDAEPTEFRLRRPDGSYVWVGAHSRFLLDEEGRVASVVVGLRDIDDEVRARQALNRSRDEAQRLIARIESLFVRGALLGVEMDLHGTVTWVSESARTVLGYSKDEIVGKLAVDWIHPDDLLPMDLLAASLGDDLPSAPVEEVRLRLASGEYASFGGTAARVEDTGPGDERFDVVLMDISERRAAEVMREQLTAVVSQELRNPLAFVFGSLQLLESGALSSTDERGRALVTKMRLSTQRLANLVESLLGL